MLGNWIGEDGSQSQDMSGFFQLFAGLSATVIVFTYSANILGQWIGESELGFTSLATTSQSKICLGGQLWLAVVKPTAYSRI